MKISVFIVSLFFVCSLLPSVSFSQNKVVVVPLIDDNKPICTGTLVGTRWCDNGEATVTDMTTGLVWLKYADWEDPKPWRSNTSGDYDDARTRAGLLHDSEELQNRSLFR